MKKIIIAAVSLVFALGLLSTGAVADETPQYYKVFNEKGDLVLCRGAISQGDRFITNNKEMYEITSVDGQKMEGKAALVVTLEDFDLSSESGFVTKYREKGVGIYVRNSYAGYIPSDGTYFTEGREGGLYDCARMLSRELDKRNCPAYVSSNMHSPSENQQSAQVERTVEQLARAHNAHLIINTDMDTVPKEVTQFKLGNKYLAATRLVVYTNQAYEESLALARRIVAISQINTPGLIRDIYITELNEPSQQIQKRLTMELGSTHNDKGRVMASLSSFAEYINLALYGGVISIPVQQEENQEQGAQPANMSSEEEEQMQELEVKGEYRQEAVVQYYDLIYKWAAGITGAATVAAAVMRRRR